MKLKSLTIFEDYVVADTYSGTIVIKGKHGDVQLKLTKEQADKLVRVVAEELVVTAKEVATNLTAECIEYREQKVIQG